VTPIMMTLTRAVYPPRYWCTPVANRTMESIRKAPYKIGLPNSHTRHALALLWTEIKITQIRITLSWNKNSKEFVVYVNGSNEEDAREDQRWYVVRTGADVVPEKGRIAVQVILARLIRRMLPLRPPDIRTVGLICGMECSHCLLCYSDHRHRVDDHHGSRNLFKTFQRM